VVLAGDEKFIHEDLLSSRLLQEGPGGGGPAGRSRCLPDAIQQLERTMIAEVLERNQWNKTRAARELRISRRNLIRKVKLYNLERPRT